MYAFRQGQDQGFRSGAFFGRKCNNSRFNMSESEYSSEDDEDYVPGKKWRHCEANLGHHD